MAHTSASVEALLLQAFKNNSRESLKETPAVWKLGDNHVAKFVASADVAVDHQINAQIMRALGLQTVQTEAVDISWDVADQYDNDYTNIVLMSFSPGRRLDVYHAETEEESRNKLYKKIAPPLFACGVIGNLYDSSKTNIMIEGEQPVLIDTAWGLHGKYHEHVNTLVGRYTASEREFPHFSFNFQTSILIDAVHQADANFRRAILMDEFKNLTPYQPIIEERSKLLNIHLRQSPDVESLGLYCRSL